VHQDFWNALYAVVEYTVVDNETKHKHASLAKQVVTELKTEYLVYYARLSTKFANYIKE